MTPTTRFIVLAVCGCACMNAAFILPVWDTWARLIMVISLLGLLGLLASWGQPQRPAGAAQIVLAAVTGVAIYGAAWVFAMIPAAGAKMVVLDRWTGGRSAATIALTLPVAVIGEELFWRATILRLGVARFGVTAGVLAATSAYALAHVASGTWLLPFAAFSAGVIWAGLLLATRNVVPPIVSHLVFDALLLIVAPLR